MLFRSPILVAGQRTRVVGRVSMDKITVDVTDIDTDTPRLSAHGAEVAALIDIRRMTVSGAPVTAACVVLPD